MRYPLLAAGLALLCAAGWLRGAEPAANALTPAEQAAGWVLLFDGTSTAAWRNFRSERIDGAGWTVEDGCLKLRANGQGGGDLCTREKYADFEFSVDIRMTPGANSGVIYHVNDIVEPCWQTGPEVAIQEEAAAARGKHCFGALYDMIAPNEDKLLSPLGGWNELRIKVQHNRVEHWVNGRLVVAYPRTGPGWDALVAASKFRDMPHFGKYTEGFICLQDHGNEVWYRNLKIRPLD